MQNSVEFDCCTVTIQISQAICQGFYGLFSLPLNSSIMYDEMAHRTFSVNSTVMTYNILKYEHYLPQLNLHTANNMVEVKKGAVCPGCTTILIIRGG